MINILTAPTEAFTSLKDKPAVLFPLLLIAILTASVQYGYFQHVDRDFMIEQLIIQQQTVINVPEGQLRANLENVSTSRIAIQSAVSVLIFIPLIMCLYAGYLNLISKFSYDEISQISCSCYHVAKIFGFGEVHIYLIISQGT